ncbi:phosphonate monoester hydrolase [Rhodosalinus halophilus]|uniref:Phosphonate monoester hydrolase n=1 Tax=Rhodosalinus halophilus TaxID=2259333 RepID=A0A365UB97_9RHOB|nr:sulfatase-like hydrolase/transferase [Rhodosalinus halophilus]RBI86552.1 phosphonate monoester hydrolase [Rhodosalinus halophilus]
MRPNILLITADQWRGDWLGALGFPVRTPALDALAAEGTLFARHHAPCAPCSPARASLHTGLYQMNHRVVWNGAGLDARFDNLALAARRAGYLPTLFGYTDTAPDPRHLAPADPARATFEGVLPGFHLRQGLDEAEWPWITWLRGRGHPVADPAARHASPGEPGETISRRPPSYGADETQTAFLTEAFLAWLNEQEDGRPWFAHLSFLRPHPPFVVPEPYASMYAEDALPPPVRADSPADEAAQHPFVAAIQGFQELSDFVVGGRGLARDLTARDFARLRAIYAGMISEVDAQIGRLVDALRAAGQWDETVVVFTSDHGEMLGDHWMLGKGGFFEESYRIPLILRLPGQAGGGYVEAFTSAVDIFPTLAELMGVAPGQAVDGASLLPFVRGERPADWRDAALWEFDFRLLLGPRAADYGLAPEDCVLQCRRDDRHLYVASPGLPPALYDLSEDPGCLRNRADDPAMAGARLAAAEALIADRARLMDRTLANRAVWDWPAG